MEHILVKSQGPTGVTERAPVQKKTTPIAKRTACLCYAAIRHVPRSAFDMRIFCVLRFLFISFGLFVVVEVLSIHAQVRNRSGRAKLDYTVLKPNSAAVLGTKHCTPTSSSVLISRGKVPGAHVFLLSIFLVHGKGGLAYCTQVVSGNP